MYSKKSTQSGLMRRAGAPGESLAAKLAANRRASDRRAVFDAPN